MELQTRTWNRLTIENRFSTFLKNDSDFDSQSSQRNDSDYGFQKIKQKIPIPDLNFFQEHTLDSNSDSESKPCFKPIFEIFKLIFI